MFPRKFSDHFAGMTLGEKMNCYFFLEVIHLASSLTLEILIIRIIFSKIGRLISFFQIILFGVL